MPMTTTQSVGGLALGSAAVLAMLVITSWPHVPSSSQSSSRIALEGLPTMFAGQRPQQLSHIRTDKHGNQISDSNVPKAFRDAAKRVQLENAIRVATEQLEREREAKAAYEHTYSVASALAVKEGTREKLLHSHAKEKAAAAVEEESKGKVESDKAQAEEERLDLEKKIATLMTFKSHHLKEASAESATLAEDTQSDINRLKTQASALKQRAHSEQQNANAIVTTAKELLASAKKMSEEAARVANSPRNEEEQTLLERLHHEKAAAHAMYSRDMHDLAKAQLKMKGLTGVEGIDEVSRTEEGIADAKRKMKKMGERDDMEDDDDLQLK